MPYAILAIVNFYFACCKAQRYQTENVYDMMLYECPNPWSPLNILLNCCSVVRTWRRTISESVQNVMINRPAFSAACKTSRRPGFFIWNIFVVMVRSTQAACCVKCYEYINLSIIHVHSHLVRLLWAYKFFKLELRHMILRFSA